MAVAVVAPYAGSLRRPRLGSGVGLGQSVSVVSAASGCLWAGGGAEAVQDPPPARPGYFHHERIAEEFLQVGTHRLGRGRIGRTEVDQQDAGLGGCAMCVGGFGFVGHLIMFRVILKSGFRLERLHNLSWSVAKASTPIPTFPLKGEGADSLPLEGEG